MEAKEKVILLGEKKIFDMNKRALIRNKRDFEVVTEGSVERVRYNDKVYTYVDLKDIGGRGHHLSRMFMADVDRWLEINAENQVKYDNNYREQMFNVHAIEKSIGNQLVMIDINDCYWRTAYLLGYISEMSYIKGMKTKSWKVGRNACIGSLSKTKVITPFKGGEPQYKLRKVVKPNPQYQYIRNHIIWEVYNLFNELFLQLGNTFYMFLTDCLVTEYDKLKEVQKFLNGKNYRCKHKPIEFLSVDRVNKKISWLDFQSSNIDEYGRDKKAPKEKYYIYSNAQVVQSELLSGIDHFKNKDYR